jgi:hypothetical protein
VSTCDWKLDLQVEGATRLPKLARTVPLERIAEDIAATLAVLCCHRSSISGTAFSRVAYCVSVERDLFDRFFNSASGYRAAYFRSPWEGIGANAAVLKIIAPKLLTSGLSTGCGLSEEFMCESLATPSTKLWLAEHGKEEDRDCKGCQGEWSTAAIGDLDKPEILNGRWDRAENLKAKWGSKAPYVTKLRILGAFLDERFNEYVSSDKRFRAREIYEFGWS